MGGLVKGFKGMIMPETFSVPASMEVKIGNPQQVSYSLLPLNSSNQKIRWSSANTNIATIDSNGTISGVAIGSTTITGVVDANGVSQTLSLTVSVVPVTGISLNETEAHLRIGQTIQLEATVTPENASNKNVNWISSNTSIATVDSTGLVTVISDGEVTITATTVDGGYTATCEVQTKWTPGENTVLYLPMKEDLLDHSGNDISVTSSNTILKETDIGFNAGYFGSANNAYLYFTNTSNMSGSWTICTWFKTASNANQWFLTQGTESSNKGLHLGYGETSRGMLMGFYGNDMDSNSTNGTDNEWHLATFTYNGGGESKIYLDGKLIKSGALSGLNTGNNTGNIGKYLSGTTKFDGYMSEWIMENVAWTQQDITDYFNNSKADYGYDISYYQELEYIQSSGTQYILTNIKPTNNTKTEFKLSNWTETGSHQIFGEDVNWSSGDGGYSIVSDAYHFNQPVSCSHGLNNGNEHEGEFSQQGLYVDGVLKATPATKTFTASRPMAIFCLYRNGSPIEYSAYKLYYFKIYEGQTQVRDFIPVKRKSDGEIGLFDKVEQKFYKNSGSGSFTAGPKIGVSLDTNSISLTTAGQTYQLTATPNPSSVGSQGYTWTSSDTSIATVSSTGLVTCVTPGECVITCTAVATGDTDTCNVGTVEEYVLLSEGGSVNRFSELSQATNNTSPAIRNNTTNRIGQALQTDRNTPMYKTFTKEIVGFDMIFQLTETYSYEGMEFILQSSTGTARDDSQAFHINTENDSYSGRYGITIWVDNSQIHNTGSTTRNNVRVQGSKSGTTWTITVSGGASFTKTFTTSNVYKAVHFTSRRRYTSSNIGNFQKVILYLK